MIRRIVRFCVPLGAIFLTACANISAWTQGPECPPIEVAQAPEAPAVPKPVAPPPPPPDVTQSYDTRTETPTGQLPDGRLIVGALERVKLLEPNLSYVARIDSGAETSSVDARDVVLFERDGERWVRFSLRPVEGAEPVTLEKPVVHFVRVNQTTSDKPERRPVVYLQLQLGSKEDSIKMGLTDRSSMTHAVLLGREYLLDRAVIDISRSNIQALP